MHGLIFETSVWLLAESTRLISFVCLYDVWSLRACACMCGMCVYRQSTQHITQHTQHIHTKIKQTDSKKEIVHMSFHDVCQNCVKDREEEENMNVLSCSLSFDFLLSRWSKLTSMDILIDLGSFVGIGIGTPQVAQRYNTCTRSFISKLSPREEKMTINRSLDRSIDWSLFPLVITGANWIASFYWYA